MDRRNFLSKLGMLAAVAPLVRLLPSEPAPVHPFILPSRSPYAVTENANLFAVAEGGPILAGGTTTYSRAEREWIRQELEASTERMVRPSRFMQAIKEARRESS